MPKSRPPTIAAQLRAGSYARLQDGRCLLSYTGMVPLYRNLTRPQRAHSNPDLRICPQCYEPPRIATDAGMSGRLGLAAVPLSYFEEDPTP